jgi:hypothetical protein
MSHRTQSDPTQSYRHQPSPSRLTTQAQAKREGVHKAASKSQSVTPPAPIYAQSVYRSAQTQAYRQAEPQAMALPPSVKPPPGRPSGRQAQPRQRLRSRVRPKAWVAGGSMAFLAALAFMPGHLKPDAKVANYPLCQTVVKSGAQLSRDQLSRLLSIPERSPKAAVQRITAEPYCTLAPIEARAGVKAEREAYPLAFDLDTWLVLLYENGEYAGYDFTFRQPH